MAIPNALFAVFAASHPEALRERLEKQDRTGILFKPTSDESWLLIASTALTTVELANALGITDGSVSSAIVVRVENYFGRANTEVWEWISAKLEVPLASAS